MFKNRHIAVSLVKTEPGNKQTPEQVTPLDLSDVAEIAMYHAPQAAKIVGAMYLGKKVIDTACEIAVIKARGKLW